MLIDAGNNADGRLVIHYLKSMGIDHIDILVGTHPHEDHIGGMDAYALAFKNAKKILADGKFEAFVKERYASFDTGFGKDIEKKKIGFTELEKIVHKLGEPTLKSGKQEYLENLLNTYLHG